MDLSRIARGGTPITLDRPRLLLFDVAATWALICKYGDKSYLRALYGPAPQDPHAPKGAPPVLVLNDMDALQFYLWVGLQADCKLRNEELTLDDVGSFITPFTFPIIFNTVLTALGRNLANPSTKEEAAGKADATAAGPAVAAPNTRPPRSTSSQKSGSRSAPSAGRPKGSGRGR